MILAIDPANEQSAYCVIDTQTYKPIEFGKVNNDILLSWIINKDKLPFETKVLAIEMISSYGMAVGKEIFETCVWIGRFTEAYKGNTEFVYRKDVKMNLCNTMRAKDTNVRQALIDRFGIVGIKKNKGWFYGFKADIWSAYAVGTTYIDKIKKEIS